MLGCCDVAGDQHTATPGLLHPAPGFLRVLVLIEVADQQVRAFARERDGDRAADAAVTAGDDRHLVLETPVTDVALLAVIGPRRHLLFRAGRRLLLCGQGHGCSSWGWKSILPAR